MILSKELVSVENYGELPAPPEDTEELTINVQLIVADIKNKLGFLPKNYSIRIGWHTVVWQEDGSLSEPTQAEYAEYVSSSAEPDTSGT